MQKRYVNYFTTVLLVLWAISFSCSAKNGTAFGTVAQQMSSTQKEIQASYSELVKDGSLAHDLGIKNMRKDFDFVHDQEVLLYLVEQLEKRSDELSKKLLSKINNLFYLRLHRVLAHFDRESHCQQGRLVHLLRKLYTHDGGKDGQHNFPFQTALTKMMLQIAVTSTQDSSIDMRDETLLLVFEQAQESLMLLNTSLGSAKLDEHMISDLVDGLSKAMFAPQKDGAFTGLGKKIVTAVVIVACVVVVMVVGYYLIKWLLAEGEQRANGVVNNAAVQANGVIDHTAPIVRDNANLVINNIRTQTDAVVDHAGPAVDARIQALGQQANAVATHAATQVNGIVNNTAVQVNGVADHSVPVIRDNINNVVNNVRDQANAFVDHAGPAVDARIQTLGQQVNGVVNNAAVQVNGVVDHTALTIRDSANLVVNNAGTQANALVDHAVGKLHDPAIAAFGVRVDHAIELGSRMSDPHGPLLEALNRANTGLHDTLQNGLRDGIKGGVREALAEAKTSLNEMRNDPQAGYLQKFLIGGPTAPAPASSSSSSSSSAAASSAVLPRQK